MLVTQFCPICKKQITGYQWNNHGSLEYIKHCNFYWNIKAIFKEQSIEDCANKFIDLMNDEQDMLEEFIECFRHFLIPDAEVDGVNMTGEELKDAIIDSVRNLISFGNI